MYSKFEKLLKERGVTAYKVAQATGVSTATLTSWKKGVYTPKPDKLQKIADYFGVPISYFLEVKQRETECGEFSLKNVPTEVLLEEIARRCKTNE